MIRFIDIQKSFGERTLFSEVNLTIGAGEKVGLVGRNGTGKSTFLKMILGQESPQEGTIEYPSDLRIRALEQKLNFEEETVLKQVASALPQNSRMEDWKAKSILMGLGFSEKDFDRPPKEFSSGYQVRIRLAEALVSESDCLLLDEPTNYLDIVSLRWLERFLKKWKGTFILVTHDQRFMEQVVEYTVAIHRTKMRKMRGGPKKLLDHIKKDEEIYEKTRKNQIKKKEQNEEFIRTFRAGARSAGLVQSRIKSLAKQKIGEKLEHLPDIKFNFKYTEFKANSMIEATDISFGYEKDKELINHFSLTVNNGDKIAIIGKNGKGKSTLLNLLVGKLKEKEGKINRHPNLQVGYFGTESLKSLSPELSILEHLIKIPDVTEQQVRNTCGSLLFTGNEVKKRISTISGGEKSRVCLASVLLFSNHLLALDEPTNHLDMESCEALGKSLKEFPGTVLLVTHNENILSTVANKLVVFDGGTITVMEKTYDKFLASCGWMDEESISFNASKGPSEGRQEYIDKKEQKKRLRMIHNQIKKTEEAIEQLEKKKEGVANDLNEACLKKDTDQIKDLGIKLKSIDDSIDEYYKTLEDLAGQESAVKSQIF